MENQRAFKGIWIPAHIWENPKLSGLHIKIWGEIDSFTHSGSSCFATNNWIAKKFNCSTRTVQRIIDLLVKENLIQYDSIKNDETDIFQRFLRSIPHDNNVIPPRQKCHGGGDKFVMGGGDKFVIHNNTISNTTNIKKEKDTIVSQKKADGWFKKITVEEFEAYQLADGKTKGIRFKNIWLKHEELEKLKTKYGIMIADKALELVNLQKEDKPEKQQHYLSDYNACLKWSVNEATKQFRNQGLYNYIKENNPDYDEQKDTEKTSPTSSKPKTFIHENGREYYTETGKLVIKSLEMRSKI